MFGSVPNGRLDLTRAMICLLILLYLGHSINASVRACEAGLWHLRLWNPLNPLGTVKRVPWFCRSWRHAGDCRHWRGAVDFVRCREALESGGPWTYLILTFPQAEWPDKWALYREGVRLWTNLLRRLKRRYVDVRYIQTWERHQRGGAHVNITIESTQFQRECYTRGELVRHDWLSENAGACGFGWWYRALPMYDAGGLAGYLTKLCQELTGAGPKNQIPIDAPPHFRRLRSSWHTLPPVIRGPLTGHMVFAPLKMYGVELAEGEIPMTTRQYLDSPEFSQLIESSESSRLTKLRAAVKNIGDERQRKR